MFYDLEHPEKDFQCCLLVSSEKNGNTIFMGFLVYEIEGVTS